MTKNHVTWATASVLMIAAISYWTAQSSMEEDKQTAFMMKACVDAGGSWKRSFGARYECLRPRDIQ